MKIAKQIRIQKKQNKCNMVGWAFNPSGITSEQIVERERAYIAEWKAKTEEEIEAHRVNLRQKSEDWDHSWPWEWCAFQRGFGF